MASFSGADIRVGILLEEYLVSPPVSPTTDPRESADPQRTEAGAPTQLGDEVLLLMTTIHTLTFNTMRSVGSGWAIGSSFPRQFTSGPRTAAGTMIFNTIEDDPFRQFYEQIAAKLDGADWEPAFIDQMPSFHILIFGETESNGSELEETSEDRVRIVSTRDAFKSAQSMIIGCQLVNFGTGYSIDDLISEGTYTYKARSYIPMMSNSVEEMSRLLQIRPYRSEAPLSAVLNDVDEEEQDTALRTPRDIDAHLRGAGITDFLRNFPGGQ